MKKPSILYVDKNLGAEIRELLPDSGIEDFSGLVRHLFRAGVAAEREHRRLIPLAEQEVSKRPSL